MCADMTTTTTTPLRGIEKATMAVSTQDGKFVVAEYVSNVASGISTGNVFSQVYVDDIGDPAGQIYYTGYNDKVYISTRNNLYIYSVDQYVSNCEASRLTTVVNSDGNLIIESRQEDNSVWAVQAYKNKVVKMDDTTLDVITEYSGLDAPFKIRYSEYHKAYFVAGSHVLWQINDTLNTVTMVYEVKNYSIKDLDLAEDGTICLLLDGDTDGYIRILNKNLYGFLLNQKVSNENLRYCKYCQKGKFYILAELDTITTTYSAIHYLFDISSKSLERVSSDNIAIVTTTTTTLPAPSKAIQIQSPIGGEQVELGSSYDIKWVSSKSASDFVSIDLYKQDELYSSIVAKTQNSGVYGWVTTEDIEDDINYKVRVTWISTGSDASNYDTSANFFSITRNPTTTTTTTAEPKVTQYAIAVDYSANFDQIVVLLKSGAVMTFDLSSLIVKGLTYLGITNLSTMSVSDVNIQGIDRQIKVRIWVGSEPNLSNLWDSGEIVTSLTSMYYGGGNNLQPGKEYYVNIQVCSQLHGWGAVQSKTFVMPK